MTVTVYDRLMTLTRSEWDRLYSGYADSFEFVSLLDALPPVGFQLHSICVRDGDKPLLHLPIFQTEYALHDAVTGHISTLWRAIGRWVPAMDRVRLLGIGIVEHEWGHIGFDPTAPAEKIKDAWSLAQESFDALARSLGARLKAFIDLNREGGYALAPEVGSRYCAVPGQCCGVVPIRFDTLDGYLARLSKATRKDLRRKFKVRKTIRVVHTSDPSGHEDRIYRLYRCLVDRSETRFGEMQPEFFSRVTREVPGAFYTLYFKGEELVAFNLLLQHGNALIDKYFCMSEEARQHSLYFISWLENISYCLEHKLAWYHAGPASPELKRRLGAEFYHSVTLFRHRNRLVHALLVPLSKLVDMGSGHTNVVLGGLWRGGAPAESPAMADTGPYRFMGASY